MTAATVSRIKASCSCGKKYMVKPEFTGKRVRCKCGEAFTVPPVEESEATPIEKLCVWCDARIGPEETACESCDREAEQRTSEAERARSLPWWKSRKTRITAAICVITIIVAGIYQTQLNGPEFVKFYFAMGVVCCVAILVARLTSCPIAAFVALLLAFEAIGAIRYGYGLTQGMHRFGMLGKMMLFGPVGIVAIPFLDRFGESSGGGGSSSWGDSSYSSCGSSCGGGGCGGGGCGGCGG